MTRRPILLALVLALAAGCGDDGGSPAALDDWQWMHAAYARWRGRVEQPPTRCIDANDSQWVAFYNEWTGTLSAEWNRTHPTTPADYCAAMRLYPCFDRVSGPGNVERWPPVDRCAWARDGGTGTDASSDAPRE